MAKILILSKNNKAVLGYVVVGFYVLNKLTKVSILQIQPNTFKKIKKFMGNYYGDLCLLYLVVTQINIHKKPALLYFFLSLLKIFFFKVISFMYLILIEIGYYFYVILIDFIVKILYYFFPEFSNNASHHLVSFINVFKQIFFFYVENLLVLINSLWFQIFPLVVNYQFILNKILLGVEILISWFECFIGFILFIAIKEIRENIFSLFSKNGKFFNLDNFLLVIKNYVSNWLKIFHSYQTVHEKIFFVCRTLGSFLILIISIIRFTHYTQRSTFGT